MFVFCLRHHYLSCSVIKGCLVLCLMFVILLYNSTVAHAVQNKNNWLLSLIACDTTFRAVSLFMLCVCMI